MATGEVTATEHPHERALRKAARRLCWWYLVASALVGLSGWFFGGWRLVPMGVAYAALTIGPCAIALSGRSVFRRSWLVHTASLMVLGGTLVGTLLLVLVWVGAFIGSILAQTDSSPSLHDLFFAAAALGGATFLAFIAALEWRDARILGDQL